MTTDELNTIVAAVVAELEKSGVDFDYKAKEAKDDDLVFVIRGTAPDYQGVTVTWKGLLDIITAQATQAKNDAVTAKNTANTILTQVQNKGTEITNFVATSKAEIETQKDESVNAVKSVYQTDLNELKGDLDKTEDATIVKKTEDIKPAEVINGVVWYRYSETKASYYSSNKYGYKKYVVADLPSKVIITTFTLDTGLQYVFVDNDNNIILDGFTEEYRICDEVVVPKNATYLYVNFAQNYVTTEFSPYGVKGFSDFVKKEKKELSPTKAMVADGAYDGYYLFSSNSTEKAVHFTDDPNFQSYVKRVKTGDKIRLKSSYFSALAGYVLTDMTMKVYFVKHTTSSGSEAYDDTITIDRDGYVYYTAYGTSAFYEQDDLINTLGRNTDRLYGKKIFFDGDSITMASGGGVIGYVSQIERITGCITQNLAVDGGTLTSGTTVVATGSPRHHVCESILNSDIDTDIYCISGGYNDFGIGQSDVGTYIEQLNSDLSVYDTTTLYGALDYIFTWLMVNRSGKPILFIMTHNPLNYRISGGSGKTANITLEEWFEAIKKMCKKYSVPYVNLFDETPLMTKLDSLKQFTVNNDGVHPTTEGYKRYYVPKIISALHSICPIDFE